MWHLSNIGPAPFWINLLRASFEVFENGDFGFEFGEGLRGSSLIKDLLFGPIEPAMTSAA